MREGVETIKNIRIALKERDLPLKLRIDHVRTPMMKMSSLLPHSLLSQVLMISQKSVADKIRSHLRNAGSVMGPDGTANIICHAKIAMKCLP
jgi:cysteine synthase